MEMQRNRPFYLFLIILIVVIGLLSRSRFVPEFIYPYLGDFMYAVLIFFIIGFVLHKQKSARIAFISITLCYMIEIIQLYQSDWINTIRSYTIGGLILGHGFLWSDLISYTVGGITAYTYESIYYKQNKKIKPPHKPKM